MKERFRDPSQASLDIEEDHPDYGAALMKRTNQEIEQSDKDSHKLKPSFGFMIGNVKISASGDRKEIAVLYNDNRENANLVYDPKTDKYKVTMGKIETKLKQEIEKRMLRPELWD